MYWRNYWPLSAPPARRSRVLELRLAIVIDALNLDGILGRANMHSRVNPLIAPPPSVAATELASGGAPTS